MHFQDILKLDPRLLGSRIRQAREKLRLSQEDFATLVGKDQKAISEYETGKRKLAVIDLPTFANVLKVPVLYFFEGETYPDNLDDAVLHEFHRLKENKGQEALIDVLRTLVDFISSTKE